ncbi:helix-turn-helix transcriptional regulator [Streptomyces sp. NPDC001514]
MRRHLADSDLSPAKVAKAHHISMRYLYVVLGRNEISFGDRVRTHRLEECRRELSRIPARAEPIAAIAGRWGFKSPAHFSRAFKSAYGLSPQAWRESRLSRPSA